MSIKEIPHSEIKELNNLKSYEMYPPTHRPYIIVNLLTGKGTFYMNGMEKNPTRDELAQYAWDLSNTLAQCERQLMKLQQAVSNYLSENSADLGPVLEEYLEDYPETEITKAEIDLADLEFEVLLSTISNKPTDKFPRIHKLREFIAKKKGVKA